MIIICVLGQALRARKDQKSPNAGLPIDVPVNWHCPNWDMFFPMGFHVLNHNSCKEKNSLECLSHSALCAYGMGSTTHVP